MSKKFLLLKTISAHFLKSPKLKTAQLIDKTKYAFVNKLVSMTVGETPAYYFDYAVFEQLVDHDLKITAYSDRFRMKELVNHKTPEHFEDLIKNKPSLKIGKRDGISRRLLLDRESKIIKLNPSENMHPTIRWFVMQGMKYAVLTPLYSNHEPIGVLWGFRGSRISAVQRKPLFAQLSVVSKAIDSILKRGLEGEYSDYYVRRSIEKIYPTDEVLEIKILEEDFDVPVTSIRFYSHVHKKEFWVRKDYLVPSGDGFQISLKETRPRYLNETKTTLLLIPGFFCNRVFMNPIAREMALKHGYRCISLDVRGRSPQTLPEGAFYAKWNFDDYVGKDFPTAIHWIKEKYGDDVVVVGHSMGGMIPRFYSAAYEQIKDYQHNHTLPAPDRYLRGIVAVASPSVIDLRPNDQALIKNLSKALSLVPQFLRDQINTYLTLAFPSINLHEMFNGLNQLHEPLREYILNTKNALPTLDQFIGYAEITPPQWYNLLENVLCNESSLVLKQFFDAQLDGKHFYSFDRKINYTQNLSKLDVPLFSIIGDIDQIVPPHTILPYDRQATNPLNQQKQVAQGHLGIGIDPQVVQQMGHWITEWIKKLR